MKTDFTLTDSIITKLLGVVDKGLCNGLGKPIPGEMCVEAAVCFAFDLPHGDNPPCVSSAVRALKINLNDSHWSSKLVRAKGMRRLAIAQLGTNIHFDDNDFAKRVAMFTINQTVPGALFNASSIHPDKTHKDALDKAAKACKDAKTLDAASDAARAASNAASYAASYAASDAARYAARAAARAASNAARAASNAASYAASYAASDAARAASNAASYAASYAASDAARYAAGAAASDASNAARAAASDASNAARAAASDKELADFAEGVVKILIDMDTSGSRFLHLSE